MILAIIIVYPFVVWALLWARFDSLDSESSVKIYGTTYSDLRSKSKYAVLYNVVYMIRRLVFTGIASFLYSSPTAQVQLIVMHSVLVLMYI